MQIDTLKPGTKVLLVDDLLATGGKFCFMIFFKKKT